MPAGRAPSPLFPRLETLDATGFSGTPYTPAANIEETLLVPGRAAQGSGKGQRRLDGRHPRRWRLGAGGSQPPRAEAGRGAALVHGERRIKRVQRAAGGAWLLISDNDHYQPELIKPEDMKDVQILGRCEIRIGRISWR